MVVVGFKTSKLCCFMLLFRSINILGLFVLEGSTFCGGTIVASISSQQLIVSFLQMTPESLLPKTSSSGLETTIFSFLGKLSYQRNK